MSNSGSALLLLGQVLSREGLLSETDLKQAVMQPGDQRLGDRLVSQSLVDRETLEAAILSRDSAVVPVESTLLGEIAVRNEFVPPEVVELCLLEQEEGRLTGEAPMLGEILTHQGHLTTQELNAVLARQHALLQRVAESGPSEDETSDMQQIVGELQELSDDYAGESARERPVTHGWLRRFLDPEPAPSVTCPTCDSSVNTPLAIVCESCGAPFRNAKDKAKHMAPWVLRVAFVVVAGATGFMALQAGPYVIAAVLFLLLGLAHLRNYSAARSYFAILAVCAFGGVYAAGVLLANPALTASTLLKTPLYWHAGSVCLAALLAVLMLPLVGWRDSKRLRCFVGSGLALIAFAALLWLIGYQAYGHGFPAWGGPIIGLGAVVLLLLGSFMGFAEGFRATTVRPGVVIEASRPFNPPDRPVRQKRDLTEMPHLFRPFVSFGEALTWSSRIAAYHVLLNCIFSVNTIVYWIEFTADLLTRSIIRAVRRTIELVKAMIATLKSVISFATSASGRVLRVIFMPAVLIATASLIAMALAGLVLEHMLGGGIGNLVKAVMLSGLLYVLAVASVGLLACCHPASVTLKEGIQAFGYHLPGFLLLVYVTSLVLSVLTWATGRGPFRFGVLSWGMTVLLVGLSVALFARYKRSKQPCRVQPDLDEAVASAEIASENSPEPHLNPPSDD